MALSFIIYYYYDYVSFVVYSLLYMRYTISYGDDYC